MYCKYCGKIIDDDSCFCKYCGREVLSSKCIEIPSDCVDLGLPSKTIWAKCNVGANEPEEVGSYFSWGEIQPKIDNSYKYENESHQITKYCVNKQGGIVDNLLVLESADDAATAILGPNWAIPTYDQFLELLQNCTHRSTIIKGVKGDLLTGPNGNTIFFPKTARFQASSQTYRGLYWSNTLHAQSFHAAWGLSFYGTSKGGLCFINRFWGCSIRPVYSSKNN